MAVHVMALRVRVYSAVAMRTVLVFPVPTPALASMEYSVMTVLVLESD
jgi:hypothetical protein